MWKIIGFILLGFLSALLSYYNKNFLVKVVNDIWGIEDEGTTAQKVGRGFVYGLLFPVYFLLALFGLISLVVFLIIAGVIAALVFVLIWVTDNVLPNQAIGEAVISVFNKIGLRGAPEPPSNSDSNCNAV